MQTKSHPFSFQVVAAMILCYAAGFAVVLLTVGPWEAVRRFAAEALILFLWLWIAQRFIQDSPPQETPIKKPKTELILGLVTLGLLALGATGHFLGMPYFRWLALGVVFPIPLLMGLRYGRRAFGLSNVSRRTWLAVLAIIVTNILVGIIGGSLLPAGELPTPPGADLSAALTSPLRILLSLAQVLLVAAIPEEVVFRVYLQPRLAHFVPLGWAILLQALLFSALHLPQHLIRFQYPWALALAGVFAISNGVLGGYLWWRTRSLPVLVLAHLFAYPRFGL